MLLSFSTCVAVYTVVYTKAAYPFIYLFDFVCQPQPLCVRLTKFIRFNACSSTTIRTLHDHKPR